MINIYRLPFLLIHLVYHLQHYGFKLNWNITSDTELLSLFIGLVLTALIINSPYERTKP